MPIEAPALNPTGGMTVKKPAALDYKKDPTRPGGGVFILHGKGNQFQDVPEGTITNTSEREDNSEGEVMSPAAAVVSSISFHSTNHNDRDSNHNLPSRSSVIFISAGPPASEFHYLIDHELYWRWGCDTSFGS